MWEVVLDIPFDRVRRTSVPGGWLYQVERFDSTESVQHDGKRTHTSGWHPPVFVPNKESA